MSTQLMKFHAEEIQVAEGMIGWAKALKRDYPTELLKIEKEIVRLNHERDKLIRDHKRADTIITEYTTKLEDERDALVILIQHGGKAPRIRSGKLRYGLSRSSKIAKYNRLKQQLETVLAEMEEIENHV